METVDDPAKDELDSAPRIVTLEELFDKHGCW